MPKLLRGLIFVSALAVIFFLFSFAIPEFFSTDYKASTIDVVATPIVPQEPPVVHIETPEPVKALYMTACVAGTTSWRMSLKDLIDSTELNAVVIDIKDYTGVVSFPNNFHKANLGKGCVISDLKEYIHTLHMSGIYVIGRISVFQDPSYTKLFPELAVKKKSDGTVWTDYKGLSFIDVGAKPYWDYIVDISKQSYAIGFDELNYDYVRYPSDGNMQDTDFTWTPYQDSTSSSGTGQTPSTTTLKILMTKAEVLKSFFTYLHDAMKDVGPKLSVDLFGMTTTVTADMGIGQLLENAMPYFDYIAPMVYPSHYPATWSGFANPVDHPYEVVKIAMGSAVKREEAWRVKNGIATSTPSHMRPWIQDFSLGATYGPDKVQAQIQATYDVGLTSWMLWSAANKYTREALLTIQ